MEGKIENWDQVDFFLGHIVGFCEVRKDEIPNEQIIILALAVNRLNEILKKNILTRK